MRRTGPKLQWTAAWLMERQFLLELSKALEPLAPLPVDHATMVAEDQAMEERGSEKSKESEWTRTDPNVEDLIPQKKAVAQNVTETIPLVELEAEAEAEA